MKRTERHHLKENELVQTVDYLRDLYERRRTSILAGLVVVLLAVATLIGVSTVRRRNEARGVDLLADAMVALNAQVVPAGVSGGADDLPASASLSAQGSFSTEEAKLNAALPKLQAAADAYPDTASGITARYHLAGAYSALGRHDDAIREFDDVVRRAGADALYGRMARLGKAETEANAGRLDAAIAAWTDMTGTGATDLPVDAILMRLARAHAQKGDTEEARKAFTQIVDEHPASPYVAEARAALDNL